MKRIYLDLKLRTGYIIKGINTRKKLHLMDIVTYEGKEYFVNNGTKHCGQCNAKLWDLVENVPFDENGKRPSVVTREGAIKKVKCWNNFKRGIFSVYEFQMMYWHQINLRKLLKITK